MNRKVFSRSSPDICFRDGRAFLFLLRRRAARRPSTRRFAKLFYLPRKQSVASFNTTELDMVAYHLFRSNDRHVLTATPFTEHYRSFTRRWTSLNHKQ
jgi:hypothetical protein